MVSGPLRLDADALNACVSCGLCLVLAPRDISVHEAHPHRPHRVEARAPRPRVEPPIVHRATNELHDRAVAQADAVSMELGSG